MPLTIRDQYTNYATRLNIPNRTTTSSLPEHSQNPFQACPSTRRNRLSKNRKKNNSAAMLYPALECFCTVVHFKGTSSNLRTIGNIAREPRPASIYGLARRSTLVALVPRGTT